MESNELLNSPGTRVVALQSVDTDGCCYLYGRGVYEGLFVFGDDDPSEPRPVSDEQRMDPFRNPRIRLDSGKYIWGYQCWWVAEADYDNSPPLQETYVDLSELDDD